MAGKYQQISVDRNEYIAKECPIILSASALLKDQTNGEVFFQCKFQNLSNDIILAMYLSLECADVENKKTKSVASYPYLDLCVHTGEYFADNKLIQLADKSTRKYSIKVDKIIFENGSVWQAIAKTGFDVAKAPIPLSKLGELEEQYCISAPYSLQNNLVEETAGYWRCGCGQINFDESKCVKCAHSLQEQLEYIDPNYLKSQQEARIIKNSKLKKLLTKMSIIAVASILAISLIVFVSKTVVAPFMEYNKAISIMETDPDEAIKMFTELGNYKKSLDMITESNVKLFLKMIEQNDVKKADELFWKVPLEYENRVDLKNQLLYAQGVESEKSSIFKSKDYYDAIEGEYKDVQERLERIEPYLKYSGNWYTELNSYGIGKVSKGQLCEIYFKEGEVYLKFTGYGNSTPTGLLVEDKMVSGNFSLVYSNGKITVTEKFTIASGEYVSVYYKE